MVRSLERLQNRMSPKDEKYIGILIIVTILDFSQSFDKDDICDDPWIDALVRTTKKPSSKILIFNMDRFWTYDIDKRLLGQLDNVTLLWPKLDFPLIDVTIQIHNDSDYPSLIFLCQNDRAIMYKHTDNSGFPPDQIWSDPELVWNKSRNSLIWGFTQTSDQRYPNQGYLICFGGQEVQLANLVFGVEELEIYNARSLKDIPCGSIETVHRKGNREYLVNTGEKLVFYDNDLQMKEELDVDNVFGCSKFYSIAVITVSSVVCGLLLLTLVLGLFTFRRKSKSCEPVHSSI